MKSIGKPYEGKPHVRFDEGMLKVNGRPCEGSPIKISILLYFQHYFHTEPK